MKRKKISRREFTVEAALAALSGVVVTVACGDSSPSSPSPSPSPTGSSPSPSDVQGVVGSNHGHVATITAARLTAGGDVRLDIRGSADHPHTVDLTSSEVEQIGRGARVTKASSTEDAHAHSVSFN